MPQKHSPLVSVIVPVYNTEKYLRRCIDSILAQTFTDFELLLINDGSKDNSGAICDEYAKKDSRIRVFHKENGGVSTARNLGLNDAKGDYIIFLDADDYWYNSTFLQELYDKAIEYNLDIIRGGYKAVDESGEDLFERPYSKERLEYACKVISSYEFLKYGISGEFFLPLSLISRELINGFRFDANQIFLEDAKFYSQILVESRRCMFIPVYFYAYRKNRYSVSSKVNTKKLKDSFSMCYFYHNLARNCPNEKLMAYFDCYSVMMYYWTLQTLASDVYYSRREPIIAELGLEKLHKDILEISKGANISIKYWPFICVGPKLGVRLLHFKDWIVCKLK